MQAVRFVMDEEQFDLLRRVEEKIDMLNEELKKKENLMNAEETAEFLNVSSAQVVYRLAREGEIPYITLGRQKRFSKAEILKRGKWNEEI